MAGGKFGGGTGTEFKPYLVEDAADVNAVRNNLTAHYRQTKNIDMASYTNFVPIGIFVDRQGAESAYSGAFKGTYHGGWYSISNLKINSSVIGTGLFGAALDANFLGIKLVNCAIVSSANYTGSILGVAGRSLIKWCTASGVVTSTGMGTGGLVGSGYFSQSYSSPNIFSIRVSQSHSSVDVTGIASVGGLVGFNKQHGGGQTIIAEIEECYCTGSLSGTSEVGGLIGGMGDYSSGYNDSYVNNVVKRSFALNPKIIARVGATVSTFGRILSAGTSTNNFALSSTELLQNE